MYTIGSQISNFSLPNDNGGTFTLDEHRGENILLYFYPKDNTPGCTTEACNFRDNIQALLAHNVHVIGVSKDSLKSHQKFKHTYTLPFPLLIDANGTLATAFGVLKEKSMFGKKYMGIERSTFLINDEGILEKEWKAVDPQKHITEILGYLQEKS